MFALHSPAFQNGQPIPKRHARNGENISPALEWSDPPPGTRSFVLIVEDVDAPAPAFRHWAVYNISGHRHRLAETHGAEPRADDVRQGVNAFGNAHYDGPAPAPGALPHTYRFRLAALSVESLELGEAPRADEVWQAAREHLLAEADLVGTYRA